MQFDPNDTAQAGSGIFGLPFGDADSRLHLIPVPWEVTTSYGLGTAGGPEAILIASHQVDLFDIETGNAYRHGYFMEDIPLDIAKKSKELKLQAKKVVTAIEAGNDDRPEIDYIRAEINHESEALNRWVYERAKTALSRSQIPAVIGGDHSVPFGLIQAISEAYSGDFGILHIDAHADLRDAYQGFAHSHASIMFNVMEKLRPKSLVQVGIRDFSPGEYEYIQKNEQRIQTFFDAVVKRRLNKGESWQKICDEIVGRLPKNVHISFDIDGLTPDLCPNTGTPVPGGLSFDQATTLFATLAESGRRIVSFDLNEVSQPEGSEDDWDANVGARVLFKMCGWTMFTNGYR